MEANVLDAKITEVLENECGLRFPAECYGAIVPEDFRIVFKAGYKQAREEMNLQTMSLADMLLTQRQEGRQEMVEWIPQLIQGIKDAMWKDDWGVKGVLYEDMLDSLVRKLVKAKLKE